MSSTVQDRKLLQELALDAGLAESWAAAACLLDAALYLAGPENYRRLTSGETDVFVDHWIRGAVRGWEMSTIRIRWTKREKAIVRKMYRDTPTREIAALLARPLSGVHQMGAKFGIRKSAELVARESRENMARPDHPGRLFQFPSGHVPANKGVKRPGFAPGRMAETMFKKGERRGAANRNWRPIGTIAADSEGYLRIKVRENTAGEPTGFANNQVWPMLHRYLWEQEKGPVPDGHTVVFRNGKRTDTRLENLELISRRELMLRNTIHNLPKELVEVIQLNGALKRKIGNLERRHAEEQDERSA